jgi:hypothetical protein
MEELDPEVVLSLFLRHYDHISELGIGCSVKTERTESVFRNLPTVFWMMTQSCVLGLSHSRFLGISSCYSDIFLRFLGIFIF